VEGVFGEGRETSVCGSPASRRANGGTVQGVRDLRKTGYKFDRQFGSIAGDLNFGWFLRRFRNSTKHSRPYFNRAAPPPREAHSDKTSSG
jgi:hypothetical protein